VIGDSIYGGDRRLRVWLEQRGQPFVLAVTSAEPLFANLAGHFGQPRADRIAAHISANEWQRLAAGAGAKGPRSYDWARVRLARLQLSAEERCWEHWLLVRRSRHDPTELAYYVVFAPAGTSLRTLARVAGQRWRMEQRLELAKGEVGLDHYEVRRSRRLVPAHDPGDVRLGLPRRAARPFADPAAGGAPCPNPTRARKGGPYQQPVDLSVDLLPLTVPEIRHVLWAVGQAGSAQATSFVFAWSHWRRRHQARARRCHYQRHLAHL
jgi:hypothetical protein